MQPVAFNGFTTSKTKIINAAILLVFTCAFFQNIVAVLLLPFGPFFATTAIILKEAVLVILGITIFLFRTPLQKKDFYPIALTTILICQYFYAGTLLESLRQILMLPFVIMIGGFCRQYFKSQLFEKRLSFLFALIIALSFIEFILASQSEWFLNSIGFPEFLRFKGFERWMATSGVLQSFYSWDVAHYTGSTFRRMAGLNYIDPVVLGQFFAFPALYFCAKRKYLLTLMSLSVIGLCVSKGGTLAFILGFFFMFINSQKFKKSALVRKVFLIILTGSAVAVIFSLQHIQSVSNHVSGLVFGLQSLISYPFGLGIGMAGNYSGLYMDAQSGIGESFAGALMGQIGIMVIPFYLLLYKTIANISPETPFWKSVKYSAVALTLCSLISESAFTYSATALVFFIAAMYAPPSKIKQV